METTSVNYFTLGRDLLESGSYEGSVQAFDCAIAEGQHTADAYYLRGRAYLALEAFVSANNDFNKAAELGSCYSAECQLFCGLVSRRQSRFGGSSGTFGRMLDKFFAPDTLKPVAQPSVLERVRA